MDFPQPLSPTRTALEGTSYLNGFNDGGGNDMDFPQPLSPTRTALEGTSYLNGFNDGGGFLFARAIYKSTITHLTLNSASGSVTVNESEVLNLTCQVDSNPVSTIRLMNGSHSWAAHCRQRGNYSCVASNIIGAAVNTVIKLAVKCSPRLDETFTLQDQYAASIGSNVTVLVPVLAYPVPTFTWSRTSSTSQDLTGSFIPVSEISTTARLKLNHLQQEDFGDYHLTVEKGFGESVVFTVTIVPEGSPETPTNLTVTSDDPFSLLAAWKQEIDGGAKQSFTVEYSKDKVTWILAGTKEESKNIEYQQLTIPKLEPSTTYYVRVIARNKYGQKNYTESVAGLTKELEKATGTLPEASPNTGVIAGVAVGCVAVIIIIVVIVVFLMRKGFRCIIVPPDSEVVKKRSNQRSRENIEDPVISSPDSGESRPNPYSDLNRETDKQIYTELKTYVNIEPKSQQDDIVAPNNCDGLQDKTSYENMKMHTYENTGSQQPVSPYEYVERR